MSVIDYMNSGGVAQTNSDLDKDQEHYANNIIKTFSLLVKKLAREAQIQASLIKVTQCTFLFIAKDSANIHFVFVDKKSSTQINYRDLSDHGVLNLQTIVRQVSIDIGDPVWAFSCILNISDSDVDNYIDKIAKQYIKTVVEFQKGSSKKILEEAIYIPEIASGIEKFRQDHPRNGQKTAFIIMEFSDTKLHNNITDEISQILSENNIIGLRADKKEYMDDLLSNVRTYIHACDFGIAVFERISADTFNPNIALEVGYMMGIKKEVLLLKDKTLKTLQTDLSGKLYKEFDVNDVLKTIQPQIKKWILDKGYVVK